MSTYRRIVEYMKCLTIAMITVSLALCLRADAKPDEKPVGRAIFLTKSDGSLQPIFPVRIRVERTDTGKVVQHAGSLSCEVRARQRQAGNEVVIIQTVLKCDDGGTYVVTGVIYQGESR